MAKSRANYKRKDSNPQVLSSWQRLSALRTLLLLFFARMSLSKVVIIGAGIAGLCCAKALSEHGVRSTVLEASDAVGGRVRTDIVDGFRLDRGFQVYLTAYPEGARFLDLNALDLQRFEPGALIHLPDRSGIHSLHDASRKPTELLRTFFSPAATKADLLRTARLKYALKATSIDDILAQRQTSTLERLQRFGFSSRVIDSFFKPFFGGVFLNDRLDTSSRAFDFTFKMFASGHAAVPSKGMQQIPEQMASRLPAGSIRLNTRVSAITNRLIVTEKGESILADAIVVATDSSAASNLLPELVQPSTHWTGTTMLAFTADGGAFERKLFGRKVILLVARSAGPINTIVSMSDLSPQYSASGKNLVYVNLIGTDHGSDADIEIAVRAQLLDVLGSETESWRLLRISRIPFSLPDQSIASMSEVHKRVRLRQGLYLCGDHVDQASINGAMCAGRRAAESILRDFGLADADS